MVCIACVASALIGFFVSNRTDSAKQGSLGYKVVKVLTTGTFCMVTTLALSSLMGVSLCALGGVAIWKVFVIISTSTVVGFVAIKTFDYLFLSLSEDKNLEVQHIQDV